MSNEQISIICKSANFERCVKFEITISEDTAKTIGCFIIDGRLEYCNALLYRTSTADIHTLQRVQNSRNATWDTVSVIACSCLNTWSTIQFRCHYVWSANSTRTELSVRTDQESHPFKPPSVHRLQSPTARSICVRWTSVLSRSTCSLEQFTQFHHF